MERDKVHRIAAQQQPAASEPVAYLYENEEGSKELILNPNGEYARRLLEFGYTETPLYTHPAPVASEGLVEALRKAEARFEHCANMIAESFSASGNLRAERTIKARHYALEIRQALASLQPKPDQENR